MFWYSILSAFNVLTYWQTHVAALEFLTFFLLPMLVIFFMIQKRERSHVKYVKMLLLPVIEAIGVAVFVLTLYPIIFGIGEDAYWGFPLRIIKLAPEGFLGFMGIMMFLAFILTLIPKIASSPAFKTLVLGGISLIFVRIFLNFINPVMDTGIRDLIPGFWFILGFIAISGLLLKIGSYLHRFCVNVICNKYELKDGVAELLLLPAVAILGFIPVFVYGAWLA